MRKKFLLLKSFGLAFFLVPIFISRLNIVPDISWNILYSTSGTALIFLIVVNIMEWKYQKGKENIGK
ncbi:hypothetical protein M3610_23925 [Neobacillus sp. MER 74]|uniref:hypothetical protein n=1 Tax=Neobacillus sp. MER 74 TaxID=2939566 RepID=UPI00203B761A|nr:hypothetical protein [Neobacillus sp. MER 74]MCM3118277.1 hypothetical protein [Neobacillus sp. MER 74]